MSSLSIQEQLKERRERLKREQEQERKNNDNTFNPYGQGVITQKGVITFEFSDDEEDNTSNEDGSKDDISNQPQIDCIQTCSFDDLFLKENIDIYDRGKKLVFGYIREVYGNIEYCPVELLSLCHGFYDADTYRWNNQLNIWRQYIQINQSGDALSMMLDKNIVPDKWYNIFGDRLLEQNKYHEIGFSIKNYSEPESSIFGIKNIHFGICDINAIQKGLSALSSKGFQSFTQSFSYCLKGTLYQNGQHYGGSAQRLGVGDTLYIIVDLEDLYLSYWINDERKFEYLHQLDPNAQYIMVMSIEMNQRKNKEHVQVEIQLI